MSDKILEIFACIFLCLFFLFITFFLILLVGTIISEFTGKIHRYTEEGDCYDRDWNKINEVTCKVNKACVDNYFTFYPKCDDAKSVGDGK